MAENPSVLDQITSAIGSLVSLSAEGLADALGLFTAARAAISTVASGIAQAASQATINTAQAQYQGTPLTPAVLADMVIRRIWDQTSAAAEATLSGVNSDRFNLLVQDTGESYGIIDALRLYNRGQYMAALTPNPSYPLGVPLYTAGANLASEYGISPDELNTVINYSRVRHQFIPDLLKLAKNSLSAADAVEMAVKQIVDIPTAQSLFEAAGGVGEQFTALVDAAGDSAGVEKAVELAAHGIINNAQLAQIVAMSRLNPRFYYLAEEQPDGTYPLNARFLGAYEIGQAVTSGAVTAEQGMTWMLEMGYPSDQAAAFTTAKATSTLAAPKEETAAQVLKEYGANLLSEDEATTALTNLGYGTAAVPYLLQYATAQAIVAARNGAVARVKAAYLYGDITSGTVTTDLLALGIPQVAITAFLADWAVEAATPHTHLSAAQVGKLTEDGIINPTTALAKWQAMGYTATDAGYLLQIYPPPLPAPPTAPPQTGEGS